MPVGVVLTGGWLPVGSVDVFILFSCGIGDGGHALAPEQGVEGRGALDIHEGEDLLIQIDGPLGGEGLADGVGLHHRHPEHVQEEVVLGTAEVRKGKSAGREVRQLPHF